MEFNFDGRRFRSVSNTPNGEVSGATEFSYRQEGALVWATYAGGGLRHGHLIATVGPHGVLDMHYHHVNAAGRAMAGVCRSTPEVLPDGRYRVHEIWEWTTGDKSRGQSVVEEIGRD